MVIAQVRSQDSVVEGVDEAVQGLDNGQQNDVVQGNQHNLLHAEHVRVDFEHGVNGDMAKQDAVEVAGHVGQVCGGGQGHFNAVVDVHHLVLGGCEDVEHN